MFLRIGHPVQKLRRVAIGPLRDARLPLGALRELTEQEVQKLLRSARKPEEKKPASKKAAPRKAGAMPAGAAEARRPAAKKAPRKPPTGVKRAGARKPK